MFMAFTQAIAEQQNTGMQFVGQSLGQMATAHFEQLQAMQSAAHEHTNNLVGQVVSSNERAISGLVTLVHSMANRAARPPPPPLPVPPVPFPQHHQPPYPPTQQQQQQAWADQAAQANSGWQSQAAASSAGMGWRSNAPAWDSWAPVDVTGAPAQHAAGNAAAGNAATAAAGNAATTGNAGAPTAGNTATAADAAAAAEVQQLMQQVNAATATPSGHPPTTTTPPPPPWFGPQDGLGIITDLGALTAEACRLRSNKKN